MRPGCVSAGTVARSHYAFSLPFFYLRLKIRLLIALWPALALGVSSCAEAIPAPVEVGSYALDGRTVACTASSSLRTVPAGTGTEDQITIILNSTAPGPDYNTIYAVFRKAAGAPEAAFQLRSIEQQTNFVAQTALYPNNLASTLTRSERGTYSGTFTGTSAATATRPATTLTATFNEARM